jgi:hypothetical protein
MTLRTDLLNTISDQDVGLALLPILQNLDDMFRPNRDLFFTKRTLLMERIISTRHSSERMSNTDVLVRIR